jgi:hypothetical protein
MDEGGGNGVRFRRIPVFPNQSLTALSLLPAKPTTGQYTHRDSALFSCGIFALEVLYTRRLCNLE